MKSTAYGAVITVLSLWISSVHGFYFIMGERESKCFSDDLPNEVIYRAAFKASSTDGKDIGLHITVLDPQRKVLLSRDYNSDTEISFASHDDGEYTICASTNSSKWAIYATDTIKVEFHLGFRDSNVRQMLDRQNGREKDNRNDEEERENNREEDDEHHVHDEDTIHVAMQKKVYIILDALRLIDKAQQSFRIKEMKFRQIAVSINSRVFLWAILQLLVMLGTGWWQMKSLKNFFVHKKLV